ncbi:MAG: hypothetical protein Fur0041_17970 [Bacteroidia bacterium]
MLFFGLFLKIHAQQVVLDRHVDTSSAKRTFGPNRLFYSLPYFSLSAPVYPQDNGAELNWWSYSFAYGVRMKLKLAKWNALVWDIEYRYDNFSIDQRQRKLLPVLPDPHDRERIALHALGISMCDRINFGRRGNVVGNWLDWGVYGDWIFKSSNVFVDKEKSSSFNYADSYRSKTRFTGLRYINTFNYYLMLRFGGNYAGFTFKYRMNRLVNHYAGYSGPDLPVFYAGIDVSVGDYWGK